MKLTNLKHIVFLYFILFAIACSNKPVSNGDIAYKIFDNDTIHFIPNSSDTIFNDSLKILHLSDGRILMKKINLPEYEKDVTVSLTVIIKSAGDRWDKSGSFFIIPKKSKNNILKIATKQNQFPVLDSLKYEDFYGIVKNGKYSPVIELLRFMTPFGVGAFSDTASHRKPVYIVDWEKRVEWKQDITYLKSELEGEVWIGVWIDTWTKEGFTISAELDIKESPYPHPKLVNSDVMPILNTVPYIHPQKLPDLFSRKNIELQCTIPDNAKNIKLYYITSGHGGHAEGDEFVKKENIIYLNDSIIHQFIPWRDDCASFRRFNPSSGVWLIKDTARYLDWDEMKYKDKLIEERIASSDYSRSNWCPGSDVEPIVIQLRHQKNNVYKFKFSIPKAQPEEENKYNHWLVSANLYWEN